MQRRIGYYESWAVGRKCQTVGIDNIRTQDYTHLIYSFAKVSSTFDLSPYNPGDEAQYRAFNNLKTGIPLKTMIAVGGWAHNDDFPTAFSDMAATADRRAHFIQSAIQFLRTYGFDGLDIDWEYPGADDRGGTSVDTANYSSLMRELRAAFDQTPEKFLLSIAAPASFWYLRHFDVREITKSLDWINIMTYDIHGSWDANIESIGPYVNSHTNLTEVDAAIDLFLRAGASPDKLNLGLGFYGRSFTLKDSSCTAVGCEFSGPSRAGPCSGAPGILSYAEVASVIQRSGVQPIYHEGAASQILTYDGDQWIGYDDSRTLAQKIRYGVAKCLGGAMVWAIDLEDFSQPGGMLQAIRDSFPSNNVGKVACPNNQCCSAWGKCGSSLSYCSVDHGCQNQCVFRPGAIPSCAQNGLWPESLIGSTARLPCPGQSQGSLIRECTANGWGAIQSIDNCAVSGEMAEGMTKCV
ncbi:hypothetical protein K7432_014685 [Basidiobolus ranarum]|uniref:Chitinase n=1 Tax=Basidiobolus ranarum TaxID=34480 RepID=A0ABR2WH56_9FUNG